MARPLSRKAGVEDNRVGWRDRHGTVIASAVLVLALTPPVVWYARSVSATTPPSARKPCEGAYATTIDPTKLAVMEHIGTIEVDRVCLDGDSVGARTYRFEGN